MKILYGAAFIGGITILQVYVWATIPIFLGALVLNYLLAENYKKILFFTSFLPMVSNVLLNILWIPTYGIQGAAYATLISYMSVPLSLLLFKQTRITVVKMYKLLV
jgi:O-antigen/teichoic acid export membrane protein